MIFGKVAKRFGTLALLALACASPSSAQRLNRPPSTLTDQAIAAILHWRLDEAAGLATKMPAGADRDLVTAALAARHGQPERVVSLLRRALPRLRRESSSQTAFALMTLCNAYATLSRFRDAARTADLALNRYGTVLTSVQRAELNESAATGQILRTALPPSISWPGALTVPMRRAPVGVWTVHAGLNGADTSWILDTGANYSVVSETTARRLKLAILDGDTFTGTSTSHRVPVRYAVVPSLTIGQATLRNLVVLVITDEALHVRAPHIDYQMEALLGINAFRLFGRATFDDAGTFQAGSAADAATGGGTLLMDGLMPVLVARVNAQALPFNLDTGANVTVLYSPYAERFAAQRVDWQQRQSRLTGAGGASTYQVVSQPEVQFELAGKAAHLVNVSVLTASHAAGPDTVFGNIGVDLLDRFHRFTFDFEAMRYDVGDPASAPVR